MVSFAETLESLAAGAGGYRALWRVDAGGVEAWIVDALAGNLETAADDVGAAHPELHTSTLASANRPLTHDFDV